MRATLPRPATVLKLDDETLRTAGLSRQKSSYMRGLAEAFDSGAVPVRKLPTMSDEEVIAALIPIKGIGRWTAEIFLIFVLNRTDLLPVDDLGLCQAAQAIYGMKSYPSAERMKKLAEKWRPYRSIATWYLWRNAWRVPLTPPTA